MRANYWLLGLCCFCLGCAVLAGPSYPHPKSFFLSRESQFVLFELFVLFVGFITYYKSVIYKE